MIIPRLRQTLLIGPAAVLALACAGDAAKTALAPLSPPDAPLRSFTFDCDTAYKVRLKKAELGSPVSFVGRSSVAFTGIALRYTADVIKNSTNQPVAINSIAEWSEVIQGSAKLNVGPAQVDLPTNTIVSQMQGVQTGAGSIRIKVGISGGGGSIYQSACTTLPVDIQSGSPYTIVFAPTTGTKTPVDRPVDVTASLRNVQLTRLPQSGLTFAWVSGAAATVTAQSDSIFHVQPNAQGTANFQVAYQGLTRNYAIDICAASTQATSLTLNRPFPVLVGGQTSYVSAEAKNCIGQTPAVSWQSSDTTVATIATYLGNMAVVHALKAGTTYITASNGALSDVEVLQVKLTPPSVTGSVVYDPSYPTGMAHLSWTSSNGASSYRIFRKCQMTNGYTPGWEEWGSTTETSWTAYDYVMSYAGTAPPSGSYMAYYVIASGAVGDSNSSQTVYFNWDEVAEPGC